MSWLYSRALVEEFSEANSLGGEPSVPSKSTPTADEYFVIDRTMEPSTRSRFGTMSKPLTADRGEALLTWFLEDSLAKTSHPPVRGKGSKALDPDYGQKWLALSGKSNPSSRSLKTPRSFAVVDLMSFSKISWKWGSMRNGECSELTTLVPYTNGTEFGLWQTPVADDAVNREKGKWNSRGEPKLSAQKLARRMEKNHTFRLCDQVRFPTPRAWDGKSTRSNATESTAKRVKSGKARLDEHVANQAGHGTLNPDWVEWLMGFPIGWTDLED